MAYIQLPRSRAIVDSLSAIFIIPMFCTIGCRSGYDTNQIDGRWQHTAKQGQVHFWENIITIHFKLSVLDANARTGLRGVAVYEPSRSVLTDVIGFTDSRGILEGSLVVYTHTDSPYMSKDWLEGPPFSIVLAADGYEECTLFVPRPSSQEMVADLGCIYLAPKVKYRENEKPGTATGRGSW